MNHVSALKYRFLPAWLPYQCESCWNFSWGPKLSHFFHIFTHWYVTLHLWVCTFSIASMPLFTRGYVTVHPWVCHFSHAGMSPFFCGYTAFHPRACHLLLVGVSLFTLGLITFHLWVCHLSLARMISSSRGYVIFRSRICHHSLVGMSPFNSSTADLPKHTRNLFFCNKHSFLCLVVYCFHLLMSIMFFSHMLAWRTWRRSGAPQTATWRLRVALLAYGIQSSNATKLGIHQMGRVWEAGHNHERILSLDESIKKW